MYTTTKISENLDRAIMVRSHHIRKQKENKNYSDFPRKTRTTSRFGTVAYRDSLQNAFNRAKEQIYFNSDMKHFITLTYAKNDNTVEECMADIKSFIKRETRLKNDTSIKHKYIYIFEYQKRGSIHVHMIANDTFALRLNKNGYRELVNWPKGFSSVLTINDFDNNFKPHLYLFKYMKKSQRIGLSFVHSSRNLKNYRSLTSDESINLMQWRTINQEYTSHTDGSKNFNYYKNFLHFDDTIQLQHNNKGLNLCNNRVQLHLNKVMAHHQENLTRHFHSQSVNGQCSTSQLPLNKTILSTTSLQAIINKEQYHTTDRQNS